MIKREFGQSEIKVLTSRVQMAEKTVKDGEQLDTDLQRNVINAVDIAVDRECIETLKTIPVEEINADKSGIRTGVLKDNGIKTVYDIIKTEVWKIASIYGIGDNMAARCKTIANRIAGDIKKNKKIRITSDDRTKENTQLVMSVSSYLKANNLIEQCKELKERLPKDTDDDIKKMKRSSNGIKWFFVPEKKKIEAIDSYNRLLGGMAGIDAAPLYNELRGIGKVSSDEAWDDFSVNSVAFFNALEKIVPKHFSSGSDGYGLSTEILEKVENTELNLDGLKCTLRGYQVWGVKYILRQKKVLLGDEMGLGKTIQALAAIISLRNAGEDHFLVICPASVIINWCREIESKSDVKVTKVHGTFKNEAFNHWKNNGGVAVTNYESLSELLELEDYFRISMVVVDEAHYVKNPSAKRSRNVMDICKHTDRILFMTGTPIENNVSEMVGLLGCLQPDVAAKAKGVSTSAYADHFKERISPVYYRRKREDVLAELPELIQMQEWCEMTREDEAQYIRDVIGGNFMDMRRVSFRNTDYMNTSSKIMRLREIADLACGDARKILVFSFFLDTLEKVERIFGPLCVGVINGSVPPAKRQEIIDRFDSAPPGSVLAAQIQSGGTGLNIQTASVVIICEPQYKPSVENQAISRAYRMGQTRNVLVHRLLCTNTIEERIMQILYNKQEEFNTFADESSAARQDMEIDSNTINNIMEEEIRRIREKYSEDQIKLLTC